MKNNNDLKKEIEKLKEQIQKTKKEREKLDEVNAKLQDEVDSLWAMMDEMTKSDMCLLPGPSKKLYISF